MKTEIENETPTVDSIAQEWDGNIKNLFRELRDLERELRRENAELRHYRDKYWKLMECEERQMIANKRKEAQP